MKKYLPTIKPSPIIEKVPLNCPIEEIYGHFSELPNTSFLNSPPVSEQPSGNGYRQVLIHRG